MSVPTCYQGRSLRIPRHFFNSMICLILALIGFGLSGLSLLQATPTPRPERSFKCEKDGEVFFKGTVQVEEGKSKTGFLKLTSEDGKVCRLFEHTDPVK